MGVYRFSAWTIPPNSAVLMKGKEVNVKWSFVLIGFFNFGGDGLLLEGRRRLRMVTARNYGLYAINTANPLYLRNGSATGDIRYMIDVATNLRTASSNFYRENEIMDIGGSGIVFEDGIYMTRDATPTSTEYLCISYS